MNALLAPDIAIEMNGRPALSSAEDDAVAMAALFDAYPDYHREIVSVVDGGDQAGSAGGWSVTGREVRRPAAGPRCPRLLVRDRGGRPHDARLALLRRRPDRRGARARRDPARALIAGTVLSGA